MLVQKLRRIGNSLVVTIPHDEVERLGLTEGDTISIEARKVKLVAHYEMDPKLAAIVERQDTEPGFRAAMDYLKDR